MRIILMVLLFLLPIPGCTSYSLEAQHENFKQQFGNDVGKRADDPSTNIARYPQLIIDSRRLPNGNVEKKLRWQRSCRVFYEVDPRTKVIVGWRSKGTKQDCAIAP